MANVYRTARGKMVNLDQLKLVNEEVVAVGNMRVNARGDQLGVGSQVSKTRNQVMDQVYAIPDTGYSPNDASGYAERQAIMAAKSAKELTDLANNLTVNVESKEEAPAPQPVARGSLADSIAKQTTVTQEPLPTPQQRQKSNGPTRI
jgi:hypothetical protein